ncbi:response regulator transcription factor [Humisphaera borealis]|uniref:Response regulator n=1 Tax=Humisphaera borealis TaxID=2807512 RepID=A0A7M2WSJ5_9BACT|nr:response regulator [Humisphaera borealis]QOV87560.1 response regulator [Humisphaera borealis]
MRVLIVEDDPEINQLLAAYAQIAGFQPDCALTGEAALTLVATGTYSLVILDVMLPDIDGMEIARRLRTNPATMHLPIVVLTALTVDSTRRTALELGVQAFLNKPFDPDELIRVMRKWAKG